MPYVPETPVITIGCNRIIGKNYHLFLHFYFFDFLKQSENKSNLIETNTRNSLGGKMSLVCV